MSPVNTVWIDFQLDVDNIITHDSQLFDFDTGASKNPDQPGPPFSIRSHPPLRYRYLYDEDAGNRSSNRYGPWSPNMSGDYPVRVPAGSRVEITASDTKNRPEYLIAPVRLLAMRWTPSGSKVATQCDTAFLDGEGAPIDIPQFSYSIPQFSYITYSEDDKEDDSHGGAWEMDLYPFTHWTSVKGSANATCEVKRPQPRAQVCQPLVSFDVRRPTGMLCYGVSVQIIKCGELKAWSWWDPYIQVGAPDASYD